MEGISGVAPGRARVVAGSKHPDRGGVSRGHAPVSAGLFVTPALEVSGLRRSYGGVPLAEGLWRQFRTRVLRCRQNPRDGPPRRPVALDFGIAFLLERQGGIWKRLRAAPLSRSSLLVGKALAGALVGLISVGSTFAFGIVVLGIRIQGSIPGFSCSSSLRP